MQLQQFSTNDDFTVEPVMIGARSSPAENLAANFEGEVEEAKWY